MDRFKTVLTENNIELTRAETLVLQINVGLECNLACRHCHLSAGPTRKERMSRQTAEQLVAFASKFSFHTIDITGGAPELNPNLPFLIENLAPYAKNLILRSNATLLGEETYSDLVELCRKHQVVITISFPAISEIQADSQRGTGVFDQSLSVLKKLNDLGYGREGTGLELNLVSNPTGAFMPSDQKQLEKRFKEVLQNKWGLECSNVFSFANVPLGRFKEWLEKSGNFAAYMDKLIKAFNPCAVSGAMCRSIISVDWDGYLYDCDFNLAIRLPLGGEPLHFSELQELPGPGSSIAVSDHCFACTAGSGFT